MRSNHGKKSLSNVIQFHEKNNLVFVEYRFYKKLAEGENNFHYLYNRFFSIKILKILMLVIHILDINVIIKLIYL